MPSSGGSAGKVSVSIHRALEESLYVKGGAMSTVAVIAIVIGALIVLAIAIAAINRARHRREFAQVQGEAQHQDARHHRERAEDSRTEAAIAEERSKRAKVEAELNEERADQRERELDMNN
jgi:flagellar biosynthesis/type III secretory pathway M-ring protein FliF/YscJ